MNIEVEYIDSNGLTSNRNYHISFLAFIKHLAIAGQNYSPSPRKLMRTLGMLLHYWEYLRWRAFDNNRFSEPPIEISDPTEKGQFSNLTGRALADFLSKKIDGSLYTVNYEAAMRLRRMTIRKTARPDLLAFTQNSMFAIEAKGFSGACGDMAQHKSQSKTGGIPVNFTIACVSYDLYSKVKSKYHDPYNENVRFDREIFQRLTRRYYSLLQNFIDERVFIFEQIDVSGEPFYSIDLFYKRFRYGRDTFPYMPWLLELFDFYRPRLLLPLNIHDFVKNGVSQDTRPFQLGETGQSNIYIDNDRVGLQLIRF